MSTDNIFLSRGGCIQGKGCLIVNPTTAFVAKHGELKKSAQNRALYTLRGLRGAVRPNKAGTAVVVEVGIGGVLSVGEASELASTNDQLNELARAGKAWWCKDTNGGGCPSIWITADPAVAARVEAAAAARAAEAAKPSFRVVGSCRMRGYGISGCADFSGSPTTSDLREVRKAGAKIDLFGVHPDGLMESLTAAIAAEEASAEEAAIMAELEAEESARKAAAAVKAAEEKAAAELAAVLSATGMTAEEWAAMSHKKQGLALHKARMAGKL